ncbi:MAG: AAA family ATPase, partial [Chitinivibrionales bacterium]|nr:AAA family ATPase [Chitinivibrionales bacterium]
MISFQPLTALDLRFARLMEKLHGNSCPELFAAAALAGSCVQQGHICLDLESIAETTVPDELRELGLTVFPGLAHWCTILRDSSVVGTPGELEPLILDSTLLYLYRYWKYEHDFAVQMRKRAAKTLPFPNNKNNVRSLLTGLFPGDNSGVTNLQKVAAFVASQKQLCIITGGPGTGKTSTIAGILAMFLQSDIPDQNTRIALAAPTGKAAARLQEAIAGAKSRLAIPYHIAEKFPDSATTIHRLLGYIPHSPRFRHCSENPLQADMVIIDESSMVDLPLMAKLIDALPEKCRLVLLGDKDQLASVEVGAI